MTRDEILAMEAGPTLDRFIATEIMGWMWYDGCGTGGPSGWEGPDVHGVYSVEFEPSSDIAAAWEVVKKMHSLYDASPNCQEGGTLLLAYNGYGSYAASFDAACDLINEWWEVAVSVPYVAYGNSAPLVICQAALLSEMSDGG